MTTVHSAACDLALKEIHSLNDGKHLGVLTILNESLRFTELWLDSIQSIDGFYT